MLLNSIPTSPSQLLQYHNLATSNYLKFSALPLLNFLISSFYTYCCFCLYCSTSNLSDYFLLIGKDSMYFLQMYFLQEDFPDSLPFVLPTYTHHTQINVILLSLVTHIYLIDITFSRINREGTHFYWVTIILLYSSLFNHTKLSEVDGGHLIFKLRNLRMKT